MLVGAAKGSAEGNQKPRRATITLSIGADSRCSSGGTQGGDTEVGDTKGGGSSKYSSHAQAVLAQRRSERAAGGAMGGTSGDAVHTGDPRLAA